MGNSTFRTLHELLSNNPLSAKVSEMAPEPLDDDLWHEISGEMSSHSYAFLKHKHVVIYTESPLWASVAHQKRSSLLDSMRKMGLSVETLKIRHQPAIPGDFAQVPPARPGPFSKNTSKLIKETASQAKNEELRQALLRLSQCRPKI